MPEFSQVDAGNKTGLWLNIGLSHSPSRSQSYYFYQFHYLTDYLRYSSAPSCIAEPYMGFKSFFYQDGRLSSATQRHHCRRILRAGDVAVAERQTGSIHFTGFLATDNAGTILHLRESERGESHIYTAYGHDPLLPSSSTLLGFNGEPQHSELLGALLGNGYRAYSSTLMRFCSADSWSPFALGGLNAYCYCLGDPVNRSDRTGHLSFGVLAKAILKFRRPPPRPVPHTGCTGLMFITAPRPAKVNRPEARVAPNPRPSTPSPSTVEAVNDSARYVGLPDRVFAQAPTAWPHGSTSGLMEITSPDPTQRRVSASVPSTDTSRDSTPASSRSPSPVRRSMSDFVEHAHNLRQSNYYSRRQDPP